MVGNKLLAVSLAGEIRSVLNNCIQKANVALTPTEALYRMFPRHASWSHSHIKILYSK